MATTLSAEVANELQTHLQIVCAQIGVDASQARLIKYTMNAVFSLPPYVIRMNHGDYAAALARRTVATATALADADAPTIRLAEDVGPQPVCAGSWSATVWREMPIVRQVPEPVDLAQPLQAFHRLPPLGIDLPQWAPITKVRRRLDMVASLSSAASGALSRWSSAEVGLRVDALLAVLNDRCDELEQALADIRWCLPQGVIHGDAHTGNLLVAGEEVLLCDLDSVSNGPEEWDLVPSAHGATRFGRSRTAYDGFADAYGFDITTWAGWPTMRAVRDLQLATSTLGGLDGRGDVAREAAHRLRTLLADDATATWVRFA